MQNFRLTVLTFRVTFAPLTFFVSRDLKFSLNHNLNHLNSIGGNLILSQMKMCAETGAVFHLSRSRAILPTFSWLCLNVLGRTIYLVIFSV